MSKKLKILTLCSMIFLGAGTLISCTEADRVS